MKPRLLVLCSGAGGATEGYNRVGFYTVDVDIDPQPRHRGDEFVQADIRELDPEWVASFDGIHASPPCQFYSRLRVLWPEREYADLIPVVREILRASGLPYVIENVEGASLIDPVRLCGTSLGLRVRRHRLFETNWPLMVPPCAHGAVRDLVGVYGASDGEHGPGFKHPGLRRGPRQASTREAREVMEMPWAGSRRELTEAIPPAYTELIGHQLLSHVRARSAA